MLKGSIGTPWGIHWKSILNSKEIHRKSSEGGGGPKEIPGGIHKKSFGIQELLGGSVGNPPQTLKRSIGTPCGSIRNPWGSIRNPLGMLKGSIRAPWGIHLGIFR
jgi:hypothetical protein